jgi:hypothetical protein
MAVLGAMMLDEGAIQIAVQLLHSGDFYLERHHILFDVIAEMHSNGHEVDMVTVAEELRRRDELDESGAAYLSALIMQCPAAATVTSYANIVRDLSLKRSAAYLATRAHAFALNGVGSGIALDELKKSLQELSDREQEFNTPATFTASQLMGMTLSEPKWIVPDILPEGFCILAGNPKLGKSWLALNVCLAVASGGVALGTVRVEQGDVLYMGLEDTQRRLQSRLRKMLARDVAPPRLQIATEWARLDEGGIQKLSAWLEAHPAARLIVIDTLQKIKQAGRMGGNLYGEDYASVGAVKALADRYGVAIVVVHHRRKGLGGEDDLEAVSGSYGLTGAADSILSLKRERGRQDATLSITGRDVDEQELALSWNADVGSWTILGDAVEYKQSTERTAIVDALRDAKHAMTVKEIHESGVGVNSEAVRILLYKMTKEGQVANNGGKFSLSSGTTGTVGTTGTTGTPVRLRYGRGRAQIDSEPYGIRPDAP